MRMEPQPHEVRRWVARAFVELGANPGRAAELEETILLDDGKYAARTYRLDGLMAMWLVEVGLIQFYDAEGRMLRTVNVFQELEPARIAA